jgi:hypothetical protein
MVYPFVKILFVSQGFVIGCCQRHCRLLLHIPGDFDEIAVRIPKIKALHRPPGAMAVHNSRNYRRPLGLKLGKYILHSRFRDEAEINAPGHRIGSSRLKLPRPLVDIDFAAPEKKGIPAIFTGDLHVQEIPVKMKTLLQMAGGKNDMIKMN